MMRVFCRGDDEAAEAVHGAALRKVIVYLGDYIDRGLESSEVVDLLLDHPLDGFEIITLKGNHEDVLLQFLDNISIGSSWLQFGGDATLYSYGIPTQGGGTDQRSLENMQAYLLRKLPARHRAFLNRSAQAMSKAIIFSFMRGFCPEYRLKSSRKKICSGSEAAFSIHRPITVRLSSMGIPSPRRRYQRSCPIVLASIPAPIQPGC
ncbi:MAG: hypothetical protein HOO00_08815 [Rhodospirillaceae bacterium]|nr:hypothetical protein [Rhodospirillaceae bacterium]